MVTAGLRTAILFLLTTMLAHAQEQPSAWGAIEGTAFAAALEHGDVLDLLARRNISNVTMLVPGDVAIAELGEQTASRLFSPQWKAHLKDLLLYHIIEGEQHDLIDKLREGRTLNVTTLQGSNVTLHSRDFTVDSNNFGDLVQPTVTQDGVLYFFTNRVFLPDSMTKSLRSAILEDTRFSTLLQLLQLVDLELPLDEVAPITVFAPTNDAWHALDPALLSSLQQISNRADLLEVLAMHVVWEHNSLSKDWFVGETTVGVLLEGESLAVTSIDPLVALNETIHVTMTDVLATNGVLQVVDKVILPPEFQIQPKRGSTQASKKKTATNTEAEERLNIVALGDSYIAGNGARNEEGLRNYDDPICYRSDYGWAGQYAACVAEDSSEPAIDVRFSNHACSASRISDVYAKQLAGVTSKTDLVLLSIGGNDLDFPSIITQCYFLQDPRECKNYIEGAKEYAFGGDILQNQLTQLLVDIRAAGHEGTKVVLVGSPYIGNDLSFELVEYNPLTGKNTTYAVAEEIYEAGDLFDMVQRAAVEEANKFVGSNFSTFEATKNLFRGREFDPRPGMTSPDESWLFGFDAGQTFGFEDENYHYNPLGHEALGNHLCTRSGYGASQRLEEPDDGFSKGALLSGLLATLVFALLCLCLSMHMKDRNMFRAEGLQRFSQKWSNTIYSLHHPTKRAMLAAAQGASTNPRLCITSGIVFSLVVFGCGILTNFNIVSNQDELWTPIGSRIESEGSWVDSMQLRWDGDKIGHDSVLLTLIVHANGENMVSRAGATKLFEVLDVLHETTGYKQFCSLHGVATSCPPGHEHICKLYSIPTGGDGGKDCQTLGPTGFWFHNRSLFDEQVSYDKDVGEAMSLDFFLKGDQALDQKDMFGFPEYQNDVLVSSTAFVSLISLPNVEGVENIRKNIIQALLNLQEEWIDQQFDIQFLTTGSFSDEFLRSIEDDIILFPAVFLFMSIFTCVAFARRDPVQSRSMLGLGAVFTVLLSILTGYGLLFAIGVPLTSLTQVLPFVILGIGLDDSFLLKNSYERSDRSKNTVNRIRDTIDEVGMSIAMTSLTSALAFALGCTSSIPSVRWLCLYGFTTILIDFMYQITIFLGFLVLDEKRIEASRRNVLCCFTATRQHNNDRRGVHSPFGPKLMNLWLELLMKPATKVVVIASFCLLFAGCAVATTRLELGFDFTSVLPADSYVISFTNDLNNYTQRRIDVDVYFRDIDQSNGSVREHMKKYINELVDGVDAIASPPTSFWVNDFQDFVSEGEETLRGLSFNTTIQRFLQDQRFHHEGSFVFDEFGNIVASKCKISFDNLDVTDGKQVLATMKAQAKLTSEQPINLGRERFAFFSFNSVYYLWDFLIETEKELKLTTALGVTTVSIMALLFLPHWTGILFVLPMIISLYVDMMGILQLSGIDINGVSFVSIVMSLGLYVDYVLHVLLCYYESRAQTREGKVKRMLSTVGNSVLLGGLSTLFGTLPLAFTSSEVFYTVFVSFVSIVALGLGHGLLLLPVVLSLVGPTEVVQPGCDSEIETESTTNEPETERATNEEAAGDESAQGEV